MSWRVSRWLKRWSSGFRYSRLVVMMPRATASLPPSSHTIIPSE